MDEDDKLVATECFCGEEIHHPADDDAPTCSICGEPYGECCEYFVSAGIYGHRECVLRDGEMRSRLRSRINLYCTGMPIERLHRVMELVAYLSHEQSMAEGEHHALIAVGERAMKRREFQEGA